jgi:pimeloyl-ACP methyl ester carboxylesterase
VPSEVKIAERAVDVNGSRLSLLEAGEGPPVMLMHGFPDNAWTWSAQIQTIAAAGYRVSAPFLPGYPPSEPPAGGAIEITEIVGQLAALAESLGEEPVALVGHDWGGTLAYLLAALRPDTLTRAAALSVPHPAHSAGLIAEPHLAHHAFHLWLFQLPGLAEAALKGHDLALVDYLWKQWSPGLNDDEHIVRLKRQTLSQPGAVEAALGYYRSMFNALTTDALLIPPVSVPMLVIFGGEDPMRAVASGQDHLFSAPYRLALVPGAGHFLHREQPEQVSRLLLSWLDQPSERQSRS